MNRLQSLFNRLAGISGQGLWPPAAETLASRHRAFDALEKPACWRRRPPNPVTPAVLRTRRNTS